MKKSLLVACMTIASVTLPSLAETYTWNPTDGTAWDTTANWAPNGTPGTGDTVKFVSNSAVEISGTNQVNEIQLVDNARVTLKGAQQILKASIFTGNGTIALEGAYLGGVSAVSSSSWEDNPVIPSTIGIEILKTDRESRIISEGDKKHLRINGAMTGDGTVRLVHTGSGNSGVKLAGNNSGFSGKVIFDGANAVRNRFSAPEAGGEQMMFEFAGNTGDGGEVDFEGGVLKFGAMKTTSRTTTYYPFRFNSAGTNILEVGHRGESDDRISIRIGENSSSSGHARIRKVGTGTLELWNPGHRYGTEIDNGTLLVTSDKALNLYADADIVFGHDASAPGGVLKYGINQWADDGTVLETPVDVTTDYSALIRNSFAPVAIDTDGKDVTFANALASSNVGGISKYGEGTLTLSAFQSLLSPVAVSNGTLYACVNASVTGRIDVAEGATLTLYGQQRNLENATVHGGGMFRLEGEAGKTRSFRLLTANFSDFTGTVDFAGVNNLSSTADGLVGTESQYDNHLESATLLVSGAPAEARRLLHIERNVEVGALQITNANAQIYLKNANKTLAFGGKSGSESILNGQFINAACRLVKNGSDSTLTVGPGFSAVSGSSLTVNAGTLALASGMTYDNLSATVSLTVAPGVVFAGDGVFGAVDLSVNDVVVPDAATFTDKTATYPLLTATSFSGTSANITALLATLNAAERSGSWGLCVLSNGNGTRTLAIRYQPSGMMLILR